MVYILSSRPARVTGRPYLSTNRNHYQKNPISLALTQTNSNTAFAKSEKQQLNIQLKCHVSRAEVGEFFSENGQIENVLALAAHK